MTIGQNWSGTAVLVAGGAGFVGSSLVRELLAAGALVVSLDDYSVGLAAHLPDDPRLIAIEADACDAKGVLDLIHSEKIEYVFHCIGDTFVTEAYDFPERFFQRNLNVTLNLLQGSRHAGTVRRLLYVSSTEVYGDVTSERINERCNLLPVNTYAVSKLAADRLCHTFHLEHGLPLVVARIFNCYGPRATHPYVIPEIIRQLQRGNSLTLGNVASERDFTFVTDTAHALMAVMLSPLPNGGAVNVGSGRAYAVTELVERIAAIMGVENVNIQVDPARLRRRDVNRFCCDNTLLRNTTGWEPRVPLEEGLRLTVEWFRRNSCRWSALEPA
jgi:nucleoside-diphosphate-sugar epimerase